MIGRDTNLVDFDFVLPQNISARSQIDLEPGTYMALCFLPDVSGSGIPHVMLGMIETFDVGAGGE